MSFKGQKTGRLARAESIPKPLGEICARAQVRTSRGRSPRDSGQANGRERQPGRELSAVVSLPSPPSPPTRSLTRQFTAAQISGLFLPKPAQNCRAGASRSPTNPPFRCCRDALSNPLPQDRRGAEMPRLTAADATLILDHVLGDPSVPAAAAHALLAALPFPSHPTPRLRRGVLLRRLAADPVSADALDSLHLLASLPSPSPSPALAAAHLAVAAFLAASAPDFDAAARALFARPDGRARRAVEEGGSPALCSMEAVAVADQFEAAVGNSFSQIVLISLFGHRAAVEERVRELLVAEWAAIGPSRLEEAAERVLGDGALETWRAADEVARAKYRVLAGQEKAHEILSKFEEASSHVNPISTPEVRKVVDALETSCADLHRSVEDPLPAAKAAADEVLASRMDKADNLNSADLSGRQTTCGTAGPSTLNDKDKGPAKGSPSLMDWNPTAQTYEWEESPDPEGSRPQFRRPHLASPRRMPVSPLQPPENKNKRRKARKWCVLEEETLRKGVDQYGSGNWKDILANNPDVFIGRTPVDLKDKWRNMMR